MLDRLTGRPRRRRRSAFWPLTLVAAAVTGLITMGIVGRAEQAADDFGHRSVVAVATHDLEIGHEISDADVVWRELPSALVPSEPVEVPVGRVVTSPVLSGEPLSIRRVGPEGLSGPNALIGEGQRALAVPLSDDPGTLRPGDAVDLLSADSIGTGKATWVARDATVIEQGESSVTVAVDEDDAPEAARAVLDGTIVIARIGAH